MMATQTQRVSHAPPHGVKRPHDDQMDSAQRLAKRFHLLKIENQENGKLWVPPHAHVEDEQPAAPQPARTTDEFMNVDDTKDRVYIHDLDAELAGISDTDDEERVIFIPDIERKLNRIPHHVLAGDRSEDTKGQEVVLYNVPHSLSVPAEHDNVRKVILESRARAREQQQKGDVAPAAPTTTSVDYAVPPSRDQMLHDPSQSDEEDPDAMDMS